MGWFLGAIFKNVTVTYNLAAIKESTSLERKIPLPAENMLAL